MSFLFLIKLITNIISVLLVHIFNILLMQSLNVLKLREDRRSTNKYRLFFLLFKIIIHSSTMYSNILSNVHSSLQDINNNGLFRIFTITRYYFRSICIL
jgi:hypothetical protein